MPLKGWQWVGQWAPSEGDPSVDRSARPDCVNSIPHPAIPPFRLPLTARFRNPVWSPTPSFRCSQGHRHDSAEWRMPFSSAPSPSDQDPIGTPWVPPQPPPRQPTAHRPWSSPSLRRYGLPRRCEPRPAHRELGRWLAGTRFLATSSAPAVGPETGGRRALLSSGLTVGVRELAFTEVGKRYTVASQLKMRTRLVRATVSDFLEIPERNTRMKIPERARALVKRRRRDLATSRRAKEGPPATWGRKPLAPAGRCLQPWPVSLCWQSGRREGSLPTRARHGRPHGRGKGEGAAARRGSGGNRKQVNRGVRLVLRL